MERHCAHDYALGISYIILSRRTLRGVDFTVLLEKEKGGVRRLAVVLVVLEVR